MDSLGKDPARKFIYVEQAYWDLWWSEQDADSRALAQQYIAEGRWEGLLLCSPVPRTHTPSSTGSPSLTAAGAWCAACASVVSSTLAMHNIFTPQHDEATTTYVDMTDQTTLGHRGIVENFGQGAVPSVTWQVRSVQ